MSATVSPVKNQKGDKHSKSLKQVVIRFAGDSGDGIQVTGTQMTTTSAEVGNDIRTFPDFPAEIRAPQGTVAGVSGFQLCFSSQPIYTAGDGLDVLVAFNPAALKAHLKDLKLNGLLFLDGDKFTQKDLQKAGLTSDPLKDGSLESYRCHVLPIGKLTAEGVQSFGLSHSKAAKCKNMFALGMMYWLFDRPIQRTLDWLEAKFRDPDVRQANQAALKAGYHYAETAELFHEQYQVEKASVAPGLYRQITGNQALVFACLAASVGSHRPVFVAGYPITPASDILHELNRYPEFNISVFQAEDEIAAACAAIGASFGGALGLTSTSGPGFDLKTEAMGLAVMTELPLVVVDVQRAGPSTGMPTKSEQSDLLAAIFGRHGECPVCVLAPASAGDCFDVTLLAFKLAAQFMTPVIVLSDAHLANGSEPWKIPDPESLLQFDRGNESSAFLPAIDQTDQPFLPYTRDEQTLARPWVSPGTPGKAHRIGGLEKQDQTGHVSYEAENHERMVRLRAAKIQAMQPHLPLPELWGPEAGSLLFITWGSTYGACRQAVEELLEEGHSVALLQLRALHPLGEALKQMTLSYETILVPEQNAGQLSWLLRAHLLREVVPINKIQGRHFLVEELKEHALKHLEALDSEVTDLKTRNQKRGAGG